MLIEIDIVLLLSGMTSLQGIITSPRTAQREAHQIWLPLSALHINMYLYDNHQSAKHSSAKSRKCSGENEGRVRLIQYCVKKGDPIKKVTSEI